MEVMRPRSVDSGSSFRRTGVIDSTCTPVVSHVSSPVSASASVAAGAKRNTAEICPAESEKRVEAIVADVSTVSGNASSGLIWARRFHWLNVPVFREEP